MDVTGFIDLGTFEEQLQGYEANSCVVARALVCTALKDLCDWIRQQDDTNNLIMDVTKLERDRSNVNGFRGVPKKPEPGSLVNVGDVRDAAGYSLIIRGKGNRPLKAMYLVIPAGVAAEIFPSQSFVLPLIVGKPVKEKIAKETPVEVTPPESQIPLDGTLSTPTNEEKPEEQKQDLPSLEPEKPAQEATSLAFTQEEVDQLVQGVTTDPVDPIAQEAADAYLASLQVNPAPQETKQNPKNDKSGKHRK